MGRQNIGLVMRRSRVRLPQAAPVFWAYAAVGGLFVIIGVHNGYTSRRLDRLDRRLCAPQLLVQPRGRPVDVVVEEPGIPVERHGRRGG